MCCGMHHLTNAATLTMAQRDNVISPCACLVCVFDYVYIAYLIVYWHLCVDWETHEGMAGFSMLPDCSGC